MSTVNETREFFLRKVPVNVGLYKDVQIDAPTYVLTNQIVPDENGGFTLTQVNVPNRFVAGGVPTMDIFSKLFYSLTFKLNVEDTASTDKQGLVKVATVEQAKQKLTHDEMGFTLMYSGEALITLMQEISVAPTDLDAIIARIVLLEQEAVTFQAFIDAYTKYELPQATTSILGGVKIDGITLQYNSNGQLVAASSSDVFQIPEGFTAITNPLGDVNNTLYPNIELLNGKHAVELLKEILFPKPKTPNFILPTVGISSNIVPLIVERGTTQIVNLTHSFSSTGLEAIETSYDFLKDGLAYTNASSVTFNTNIVFTVESYYSANPAYSITLSDGTVLTADKLLGYPTEPSARVVKNSLTAQAVDPIWCGCATGIDNIASISAVDLIAKLGDANKLVIAKPTNVLNHVVISGGAVDPTSYILFLSPYQITSCKYVELANTEYWSQSGENVIKYREVSYTRPDNSVTTLYLYYSPNTYNNPNNTVTYNFVL